MSLIDRFFSSHKGPGKSPPEGGRGCSLAPEDICVEMLKELIPIRSLDDDQLSSFCLGRQSEVFREGSTLFRAGEIDGSVLYLLKGTVVVEDAAGQRYEVSAGTAKARFPLASGKKYCATVYAKTDASVLRVSKTIMTSCSAVPSPGQNDGEGDAIDLPEALSNSRLIHLFVQHYREQDLVLPTLPDVAVKLGEAMRSDVSSIADAARIIQFDPVIASKLIQVANCPLYVAAAPVHTCQDAIVRIGLLATRNLVIGISLKPAFRSSTSAVKHRVEALWKQSIEISSIAFTLARITKTINPEEALLAGLVSDIGILPLLHFAGEFPSDFYTPEELDAAIPYLKGPIGSSLLRHWRFPEPLADIPNLAENWFYDGGDHLTLGDVVILSRLHYYIGTHKTADVPTINQIPACSKLEDGTLSPHCSLRILHEAKQKIDEAMRFFTV